MASDYTMCEAISATLGQPNVLLRDEKVTSNTTEAGSISGISEAFVESRDQISAIGVQFRGKYQAVGNQAGVVSVVDAHDPDHGAVQLWKSDVQLGIEHLDWSRDEKYLACAELTGKVLVNRVERSEADWVITRVFSTRVKLNAESIQQFLLNDDGSILFAKNGPVLTVWHLTEPDPETPKASIQFENSIWTKHPLNPELLLAFNPTAVRLHRWSDLSEVATFSPQEQILHSPDSEEDGKPLDLGITAKIHRILPAAARDSFLMDFVITTSEGDHHRLIVIEIPTSTSNYGKPNLALTEVPREIQQQIQIPLGIIGVQATRRLVSIDRADWICSYSLVTNLASHKPLKHYFFPKDWLNVEDLQLCTLLGDGRLLMPNNGELAVIRCTGI